MYYIAEGGKNENTVSPVYVILHLQNRHVLNICQYGDMATVYFEPVKCVQLYFG